MDLDVLIFEPAAGRAQARPVYGCIDVCVQMHTCVLACTFCVCCIAMVSQKVVELRVLFGEYFGAGANCQTEMEAWRFGGYKSEPTW